MLDSQDIVTDLQCPEERRAQEHTPQLAFAILQVIPHHHVSRVISPDQNAACVWNVACTNEVLIVFVGDFCIAMMLQGRGSMTPCL